MYVVVAQLCYDDGSLYGYRLVDVDTEEVKDVKRSDAWKIKKDNYYNAVKHKGTLGISNEITFPYINLKDGTAMDFFEILIPIVRKNNSLRVVDKYGSITEYSYKEYNKVYTAMKDRLVSGIKAEQILCDQFRCPRNKFEKAGVRDTVEIGQYLYRKYGFEGYEAKYIGSRNEVARSPLREINGIPVVSLRYCFRGRLPREIDFSEFDSSNLLDVRYAIVGNETRDGIGKVIIGDKFRLNEIILSYGFICSANINELVFKGGLQLDEYGAMDMTFKDSRIGTINKIDIQGDRCTTEEYIHSAFSNTEIENTVIVGKNVSIQNALRTLFYRCVIGEATTNLRVVDEERDEFSESSLEQSCHIRKMNIRLEAWELIKKRENIADVIKTVGLCVTIVSDSENISKIKSIINKSIILGTTICELDKKEVKYKEI